MSEIYRKYTVIIVKNLQNKTKYTGTQKRCLYHPNTKLSLIFAMSAYTNVLVCSRNIFSYARVKKVRWIFWVSIGLNNRKFYNRLKTMYAPNSFLRHKCSYDLIISQEMQLSSLLTIWWKAIGTHSHVQNGDSWL